MRNDIADLVLFGGTMNYPKWLGYVAGELNKFDDLDNISPMAILPLAKIASDGGIDANRLVSACDMELEEIQEHLDSLCEFGFVKETSAGFEATPLGEKLFDKIGPELLMYERYVIKVRLEAIDSILKK